MNKRQTRIAAASTLSTALVVVSVVALGANAGASSAAGIQEDGTAATSAQAKRTTTVFTASKTQTRRIDAGAGTVIGDRSLASAALSTGDKEVGTYVLDCVVSRVVAGPSGGTVPTSSCNSTLLLRGGQVTAQGVSVGSITPALVVTGGNGSFEGAVGKLKVSRKGSSSILTLTITR
ncbi:MAG: hypothetical protein ACT4P1_03000 [Sporichthyaceae bacterium]